jgi:hypothetical protein
MIEALLVRDEPSTMSSGKTHVRLNAAKITDKTALAGADIALMRFRFEAISFTLP